MALVEHNGGNGAAEYLISVLEEHDIPLGSDDVRWAFESLQTRDEMINWVGEYLQPETLLTKDELEQFKRLSRVITPRASLNKHAATAVPVHDDEFKRAIMSLQDSTAAIERQSLALEAQKEALIALQSSNRPKQNVERSQTERQRRNVEEKHHLDLQIEELSSTITSQLTNAQRQTKSASAALTHSSQELLGSDDRTMTRIGKIIQALKPKEGSNKQADQKQIDQWCRALITFRATEIRHRISTITKTDPSTLEDIPLALRQASHEDLQAEKSALEGELDSLQTEVSSVAEMSVHHEYRSPIQASRQGLKGRHNQTQHAWQEFVAMSLDFMANRLLSTQPYAHDLVGYKNTLGHVQRTFNLERAKMATKTAAAAAATAAVSVGGGGDSSSPSPVRPNAQGGRRSLSSNALLNKLKDKDTTDLPTSVLALIRHTDLPEYSSKSHDLPTYKILLIKTLLERQRRLSDQQTNAEVDTAHMLGAALDETGLDLQDLLGAMYVNSRYGSASLSNKAIEIRGGRLEDDMSQIKDMMARLDAGELDFDEERVVMLCHRWGK